VRAWRMLLSGHLQVMSAPRYPGRCGVLLRRLLRCSGWMWRMSCQKGIGRSFSGCVWLSRRSLFWILRITTRSLRIRCLGGGSSGERFRRGITALAHDQARKRKVTTTTSPPRHPHHPACWPCGGDIHIPYATVAVLDYDSLGNTAATRKIVTPTQRPLASVPHPMPQKTRKNGS